jgi:uncharacterized membrane protein (UPF0127 family)
MITLKNLSQKKIITKRAKLATSFIDRLFGLLNPRNPRFLIFYTRFGIHTFLMPSPIDVMLLDQNRKVAKLKIGLKPNHFFFYSPRHFVVIEMPQGTVSKFHIRLNDKISIT